MNYHHNILKKYHHNDLSYNHNILKYHHNIMNNHNDIKKYMYHHKPKFIFKAYKSYSYEKQMEITCREVIYIIVEHVYNVPV